MAAGDLDALKARVRALPLWSGPVDPRPLEGGITNVNFHVVDGAEGYVVRLGDDIPVHHVMRFNEAAARRAAAEAGVSPEMVYAERGVLVVRFVEGRTLGEADLRSATMLDRFAARRSPSGRFMSCATTAARSKRAKAATLATCRSCCRLPRTWKMRSVTSRWSSATTISCPATSWTTANGSG